MSENDDWFELYGIFRKPASGDLREVVCIVL